jgi:hypothetical protein
VNAERLSWRAAVRRTPVIGYRVVAGPAQPAIRWFAPGTETWNESGWRDRRVAAPLVSFLGRIKSDATGARAGSVAPVPRWQRLQQVTAEQCAAEKLAAAVAG